MSFSTYNGGRGRGEGPFQEFPDEFRVIIEAIQKNLHRLLLGAGLLFLAAAVLTSFYTVQPSEEVVIIRLGKYLETTPPGLHFKLPFGIDSAIKVKTKLVLQEEFGFRSAESSEERTSYQKDSYEASVEKKVYERMISERKRIAEKIRSIGKGEQAKIQGKTSRDLQRIDSEAYRKAQLVRGKAEAESIAIYARAMSQDRKFYEFVRTMDAYKNSMKAETQLILSTDSEFLKLLRSNP